MSLLSRLANVFRPQRLDRELDEELAAHVEDAVEHGRDPLEARRALGSSLRWREASRDIKLVAWLDSLRADVVFGWRQLVKRKATSAAAILSLGLAIGACTAAFRIVDALFLRPLPIANPERLYALSLGESARNFTYTEIRQMRAVQGPAELIAVSGAPSLDVTYGSDQEAEKAHAQFVSGWMFDSFGLRPALGRLFTANDDLKPGGHPVAVLSYDYWTRRFARDPSVIGRTVRLGPDWRIGDTAKPFEIVGVAPQPFTGTETGVLIDIFLPTMMQAMVDVPYAGIFRSFVRLPPGGQIEPVRDRLLAGLRASSPDISKAPHTLLAEPAAAGASNFKSDYRQALIALAVLVGLVLLIACANVANLMTAQAAARSREMALRVAIGAGRRRLMQLVLVESAILALFAAVLGGLFAIWSGPFVVSRINPPDNPVRLLLALDWRVIAFAFAVTLGVTILFGLAPALRASRLQPAGALKAGRAPVGRLIAVQVAFCFLVLFVAGLFVTTFEKLSNQPTGISAARVLNLNVITLKPLEPPVLWDQVADRLRGVPGVESVAFADWPVLDGYSYKTTGVSIDGAPPNDVTAWTMNISPGWIGALRIPLLAGRDFRPIDSPGAVIVDEEFARTFFNGENPVGKIFQADWMALQGQRLEIVGLVRNARYRFLRQAMLPVVYTSFKDSKGRMLSSGTFVLRTASANPLALASILRQEVSRANPEFRVSTLHTQQELIDAQTIRERLLAMLAFFFALVALLLAGVGLYGVLDYSVFQRRREIGIRMALGARAAHIVRRVALEVFAMVLAGALAGLALGLASVRYIESLLYEVKATDLSALAAPALALLAMAVLAALPPVLRAIRIDPARVLRSE
jgi:putative ABC transport system permease protein